MLNQAARDKENRPSAIHEYMLYQTLVGAWPFEGISADFVERIKGYALKAAREGKMETSWLDPDEAYESALLRFIEVILGSPRFVDDIDAFAKRVAVLVALNGLSQLVLKATIPGVPDFYQGTEFWDLSLVDPDNRRPVDFGRREKSLGRLGEFPDWRVLSRRWSDAHIKLALTQRLLALRRQFPDLFLKGAYHPIAVKGRDADHIVAFARAFRRERLIVAVLRRFAPILDSVGTWFSAEGIEAELSAGHLNEPRDMLNPRHGVPNNLSAAYLFETLPVAVLHAG
jgi:(1->4)-alpha-D-glucan 1-alpha-D-glucosylmutase